MKDRIFLIFVAPVRHGVYCRSRNARSWLVAISAAGARGFT